MRFSADSLPVGYLRCIRCGRPALWIYSNIRYKSQDTENVQLSAEYSMRNIKVIYDYDLIGHHLCDSCTHKVSTENMQSAYMVFINEIENDYQQ